MNQGNVLLLGNETDYIYQFSQRIGRAEHITLLNNQLLRLSCNYQNLVATNEVCYALGPGLADFLDTPTVNNFSPDARAIGVYIHRDVLVNVQQVGGYANKDASPTLQDVVEHLTKS